MKPTKQKKPKRPISPKPKPRTYHEGANDERSDWMAKLKRDAELFASKPQFPVLDYIRRLRGYGMGRVGRNKSRKGGL